MLMLLMTFRKKNQRLIGILVVAAMAGLPVFANGFDEVASYLDQPEAQLRIGEANLLIGKLYDSGIDVDKLRVQLDELAASIEEKIGRNRDPHTVIRIINDHFFNDYRLRAIIDPYPEDFLLHDLLQRKKGRCMSLVALYMAIAERLDLPIVAVCVPEHIFARWLVKPKRRRLFRKKPEAEYINIETTLEGVSLADKRYLDMMGDTVSGSGSFYMRPLSRRETVGAYLSPLGSAMREQGQLDRAVTACKLAVDVNPADAEAWNNLGMTYRRQGRNDLATAAYLKALENLPDFAEVMNNLGSIQEDGDERVEWFKKAIAARPDFAAAWKNLVLAHCANGNLEMARVSADRYRQLGYELSPEIQTLLQMQPKPERRSNRFQ